MGIYERDYTRTRPGPDPFHLITGTAVGTLIFVNVVVWFVQLLFEPLTGVLAAQPQSVFGELQIWKLFTANFAHDTRSLWHLFGNMLFLYFCGRELEQMYGRRRFLTLYFVAGVLAVGAEEALLWLLGQRDTYVLGASGAVMAVVVLFACHFPHRTVLLFFFLPVPIWLLCVFFLAGDLMGVVGSRSTGVANLAHLVGAAVGLFYRYGVALPRFAWTPRGRSRKRRRGTARFLTMPKRSRPAPRAPETRFDPVSARIDELLAKISADGADSLSEDDWQFLRAHSQRYRSR